MDRIKEFEDLLKEAPDLQKIFKKLDRYVCCYQLLDYDFGFCCYQLLDYDFGFGISADGKMSWFKYRDEDNGINKFRLDFYTRDLQVILDEIDSDVASILLFHLDVFSNLDSPLS